VHSNKTTETPMPDTTRSTPRTAAAAAHGLPARADDTRALIEWRAAALRALFPLTFSRTAQPVDRWRAIAVHRFLGAATSFEDLHRRIEEVQAPEARISLLLNTDPAPPG
jgi:hypothetical protein